MRKRRKKTNERKKWRGINLHTMPAGIIYKQYSTGKSTCLGTLGHCGVILFYFVNK